MLGEEMIERDGLQVYKIVNVLSKVYKECLLIISDLTKTIRTSMKLLGNMLKIDKSEYKT